MFLTYFIRLILTNFLEIPEYFHNLFENTIDVSLFYCIFEKRKTFFLLIKFIHYLTFLF